MMPGERNDIFKGWAIVRILVAMLCMIAGLGLQSVAQESGSPKITVPKGGAQFDDTVVTFSGTAKKDGIVLLYEGDTFVNRAIADEKGNWKLTSYFDPGRHEVTVRYELDSGASGPKSAPVKFTVKDVLSKLDDTTLKITSHDDGGEMEKGPVLLRGQAPPGVRVYLTIDGGRPFKTTANEEGYWRFNIDMERGSHTLEVTTGAGTGLSERIRVRVK
ncbi:MAG: hypothetical protein J0L72_04630 [Armatimonadetes bacterium]|nr:hypothetical protein [Armatimonadota bacterium]